MIFLVFFGFIDFDDYFKLISIKNRILIANFVEEKKTLFSTYCFSKQSKETLTETKIIVFQIICALMIGLE